MHTRHSGSRLEEVLSLLAALTGMQGQQQQMQNESMRTQGMNDELEMRRHMMPGQMAMQDEQLSHARFENSPQMRSLMMQKAESDAEAGKNEYISRLIYGANMAGDNNMARAIALKYGVLPPDYMESLIPPEMKALRDKTLQRMNTQPTH